VSGTGLLAGAAGAAVIGAVSVLLTPFCATWTGAQKLQFAAFIAAAGTAGSLLDSLLGALLQESVVDVRTGKVVEAPGGGKVLVAPSSKNLTVVGEVKSRFGNAPQTAGQAVGEVGAESQTSAKKKEKAGARKEEVLEEHEPSRKVVAGWGVLSNNGVNLAMALLTSAGAMAVTGYWWHGDVAAVWREAVGACGSGGMCAL
jgi:uncharacterized membrane protein